MFTPIYNWGWLYCYTSAIQPRVNLRTHDAFGNDHANIYPNTRLHTELYYLKYRIIPNFIKKGTNNYVARSFSICLLDYLWDKKCTRPPSSDILRGCNVSPSAVDDLGTFKMPHSYYDVSDTNVDSYNTVLPCSKDGPHSMLFSDNIPAISFSNLNANAEEYIPTGTSNHNAYFNDAINPRVGAIVAVSYVLAMLTLHSLGFCKIHLPKVKPKDLIKNIKYNHPNNIVLGHLNINSLRNKFHCLKYIVCDNIDILLLSESKLNQSFPDSQFAMDGFQMPFRADRNDKGGGLLLYVKEDIPCKIISVNFICEIEAIVLEINLKKRKWLLLGIYNPHEEMTNTFRNIVGNYLNELCLKYENITIIGDFNCEMSDDVMGNFRHTYNLRCLVKEAKPYASKMYTILAVLT